MSKPFTSELQATIKDCQQEVSRLEATSEADRSPSHSSAVDAYKSVADKAQEMLEQQVGASTSS